MKKKINMHIYKYTIYICIYEEENMRINEKCIYISRRNIYNMKKRQNHASCRKPSKPSSLVNFRAARRHLSERLLNCSKRAAKSRGGPRVRKSNPGSRIIKRLSDVVALDSIT